MTGARARDAEGLEPLVCFLLLFFLFCTNDSFYWFLGYDHDHYHHQHHLDASTPTTASLTRQNATTTTSTRPNASTTTTRTHNDDKRGPRRFSSPWCVFCMSFVFVFSFFNLLTVFLRTTCTNDHYDHQRRRQPTCINGATSKRVHCLQNTSTTSPP
jgi:hypothetical protein